MADRRTFLKKSMLAGSSLLVPATLSNRLNANILKKSTKSDRPVILSTWNHGIPANEKAWQVLQESGSITDAVEQGVRVTENDLDNLSVGLQGLPDREGIVTLDASIMKGDGSCGSVAFVRQVKHPISLARLVMEETPHVMIVGEGARKLAAENGFELQDEELSPRAEEAYENWLEQSEYKPIINIENHDTIGMIGLDGEGNMAGSCTTSGLAYKMHGRVGDSPIIGAGLYVDNEVGAATATGLGESIIRICGSFLIVELMRQGRTPQEACEEAVRRLISKHENVDDIQAGFLALNNEGEWGAYAVQPGFNYALHNQAGNELIDSASFRG
ncbi:MAG: N(4)-(beta-N-acetylglucosaminyl)-L-asparaginase [Balneolaceae bacterium]|nr:N(4)-(beta-N-acetylglucosaminyl)-L-asparaginase [Balneolaceae bacterium]